jgi:hypothetical protein
MDLDSLRLSSEKLSRKGWNRDRFGATRRKAVKKSRNRDRFTAIKRKAVKKRLES